MGALTGPTKGPKWSDKLVQEAMEVKLRNLFEPIKRAGRGHKLAKPTRVYRVEFPNGAGPYNSRRPDGEDIYDTICAPAEGFNCARNAGLNREQMGVTERDFADAHGDAAYACDGLESLHDWFPDKARAYLAGLGCHGAVYEVPAGGHLATIGRGEVLFSRDEAKRVETFAL